MPEDNDRIQREEDHRHGDEERHIHIGDCPCPEVQERLKRNADQFRLEQCSGERIGLSCIDHYRRGPMEYQCLRRFVDNTTITS